MARAIDPIDRVELRDTIGYWIEAHADVDDADGVSLLEDVLWEINAQPTLTPPNEPLTLEQLQELAEPTPVWWDWVCGWVLARKGMIVSWGGRYHNVEELRGNFYRRPPEGEEDA